MNIGEIDFIKEYKKRTRTLFTELREQQWIIEYSLFEREANLIFNNLIKEVIDKISFIKGSDEEYEFKQQITLRTLNDINTINQEMKKLIENYNNDN